jgi:hypothetical protein
VAETRGLLKRAHIVAGEFRYVGKETDRKWEEGDDLSVLEFKATEYGRTKKVVADTSIADEIRAIGIRKTMDLTKMSQHTIEKLIRGEAVKRKTHEHVLKAIRAHRKGARAGRVGRGRVTMEVVWRDARDHRRGQQH